MTVSHIIGADISKKSIDFVIHQSGSYLQIPNSNAGFKQLLKWFRSQQIEASQVMIVLEHTGLYSYMLEQFMHQNYLKFTKVSALQIKRSMGIVRGKTDKADAQRIARFGFEKQYQLQPAKAGSVDLVRLRMLSTSRDQFIRQRTSNLCTVKELQEACGLKQSDSIIKAHLQTIKTLDKNISQLEAEIGMIISNNADINKNYRLLQSVKSVGKVLALATIIKTGNFTRFDDPRKFACFCGTAPFEHSSGTSIKGRTRVSHMADKRMKTLLDLAAKSAIQYDKELKQYYQNRITNGKSKMSTINVVRNKILYRMFAVINRQTPFIENFLKTA